MDPHNCNGDGPGLLPLPAFFPGYQSGSASKHPRRLAIAICPGCPPPTLKTSLAISVSDRPKLLWRLTVTKAKALAWVHGDKDPCLPLTHHSGPRGQSGRARTRLGPMVSAKQHALWPRSSSLHSYTYTHRPPSPWPSAPLPLFSSATSPSPCHPPLPPIIRCILLCLGFFGGGGGGDGGTAPP